MHNNATKYKQNTKQMVYKQAWSIKNYRYVMRHSVDVISPSSWEPQEEGMMSTVENFPSVRNQGLSYPGKSQTPEGNAC
jgi:hypothetical protein